VQKYSYLSSKRPVVPTRIERKEQVIRIIAANEKKISRLQIEEISDSEDLANTFKLKNK